MENRIENEFQQIKEIIKDSLVDEIIYTLARSKANHWASPEKVDTKKRV